METKAREFWIDHDCWYSKEEKEFNDRTCTIDEWNNANLLRVIEYSALTQKDETIKMLCEALEKSLSRSKDLDTAMCHDKLSMAQEIWRHQVMEIEQALAKARGDK